MRLGGKKTASEEAHDTFIFGPALSFFPIGNPNRRAEKKIRFPGSFA